MSGGLHAKVYYQEDGLRASHPPTPCVWTQGQWSLWDD